MDQLESGIKLVMGSKNEKVKESAISSVEGN
jgi:hypothetical protein